MKVFNKDKTQELTNYDLSKGYLKEDFIEIFVEEVKEQPEIYHYETIKEYKNGGKDVKKIIDFPYVKGVPSYFEKQSIYVYTEYSTEELNNIKLSKLREKRIVLLNAFDKWEKAVLRAREVDDENIMLWYKSLLDLVETAFLENNIPSRIKYYL